MLPNSSKVPSMVLPESESSLGHGDVHSSNDFGKFLLRNGPSKNKEIVNVLDSICVRVTADTDKTQSQPQRGVRSIENMLILKKIVLLQQFF